MCGGCANAAHSFVGQFEIATRQGPWQLTLYAGEADTYLGNVQADGAIIGDVSGREVVDEDGESSIEGTVDGENLRAEFAFYENDRNDGFHLLVIPLDSHGTPDISRAVEYPARALSGSAQGETDALRDARLVGLWTAQVRTSSAAGRLSAELYMEIRSDGYIVDRGSRSVASFDGAGLDSGMAAGGESALWRTDGSTIFVSQDAANWAPLARYEISDRRLLLTYYDGSRQLWYRQ